MCNISSKCHGHKRNKFWRTLWIFNLLPQLKALKQNIQEIAMNVMYTILTCRKENLQTPSTNKVSSHIMHYVMVDYFYSNDKLLRTMYGTSWTINLHPHLKVLPQKLQIKLNLNADIEPEQNIMNLQITSSPWSLTSLGATVSTFKVSPQEVQFTAIEQPKNSSTTSCR